MDYQTFKKELIHRMQALMGEAYTVEIYPVLKNNGIRKETLAIKEEGACAAPGFYLEEYYEAFQQGVPMEEIVCHLEAGFLENSKPELKAFSSIKNYEMVSDHIYCRIIHCDRNQELLEAISHRKVMDLAVVYYWWMEEGLGSHGSILVRKEIQEQWDVTEEELYQTAMENTMRSLPPCLMRMDQLMREIQLEKEKDPPDLQEEEDILYVLTNRKKYFGAITFLYPEVLAEAAKRFAANLYILPSSIHEVMILPDFGQYSPEDLKEMVSDINDRYVEEEEILSDRVYYYDRERDQLRMK